MWNDPEFVDVAESEEELLRQEWQQSYDDEEWYDQACDWSMNHLFE